MLNFSPVFKLTNTEPRYSQLYKYIKQEIIRGLWPPYSKLPSIRQFARALSMSHTTVENTYHQLLMEGYIKSVPRKGYYVNHIEIAHHGIPQQIRPRQEVEGIRQTQPQVHYDLSRDSMDQEGFDFSLWKKYMNKALRDPQRYLSYGAYQGEEELRKEIAKYIHFSRGVVCAPELIVVGAGIQSLLNLLSVLLKKTPQYSKDPSIGFEEPGFKKGQRIFLDHGFRVDSIKTESEGIDVDSLITSGTKVVYISPSHQFPAGATLSIKKRLQLLNWARQSQALIIEDDYDSELRYMGRTIPSLQGLNDGENVVYLGSFSKILLPSVRISYMVLPRQLIEVHQDILSQYSQTSSKIEQMALALFMKDGLLEKQIRKLRKIYTRKNHLLTETIAAIMGKNVRVLGKESGLYIVLEIQSKLKSNQLAELALQAGVKVIPVTCKTSPSSLALPHIHLSYGGLAKEDMKPALSILNSTWFENS